MEGQGKETLFKIIHDTCEKGLVPRDFEKCITIHIMKKKNSKKCEDNRIISLIMHVLQFLTKEIKINDNLEEV